MTLSLAIETSGRVGSVALTRDGRILSAEVFSQGMRHAAGLLPLIDRLVTSHGHRASQVDHLYLSSGPGSFTGVRIAVTLAKAMAWSSGVKLVAVPTPRVLAENAPRDSTEVVIVLDAKRGQIFSARYRRPRAGAAWEQVQPPHLTTLRSALAQAGRPVTLIGEGIPFHRDAITSEPSVITTPEADWRGRAEAVATLGHAAALEGNFDDPTTLTPLYLRLAEAEERRLITEGKLRPVET